MHSEGCVRGGRLQFADFKLGAGVDVDPSSAGALTASVRWTKASVDQRLPDLDFFTIVLSIDTASAKELRDVVNAFFTALD